MSAPSVASPGSGVTAGPQTWHTVCVGAGPANLSFAALFSEVSDAPIALLERAGQTRWHEGLMFRGVRMQTAWFKDLVSLTSPQHPLTFLNYLVSTGRVHAYLTAQFDTLPRREFQRYLGWAAGRLGCVRYGAEVTRIGYGDSFELSGPDGLIGTSEHLVLGLGTRAHVPACLAGTGSPRVLLADQLSGGPADRLVGPGAPVAVVGGGQTGAECVLELLRRGADTVSWIGRRPIFGVLDDSPSANDLYRPEYVRFLRGQPESLRRARIQEQVLTSDGISVEDLRRIYQANYEEALERGGRAPVALLPGRDLVDARVGDDEIALVTRARNGIREEHRAALVVIATGRVPTPPPLDPDLAGLIEWDDHGDPVLEDDYSVRWKGSERSRIFWQNRARWSHGLADPNLSLLSVRGATIVNALLGRSAYPVHDDLTFTRWS